MSDRESIARKAIPSKGGTASYTGTASTAVVAPADATAVLVWCTTDAYVVCDRVKVAATTSDCPLPAYTPIVLSCEAGDSVSAIRVSASGSLFYCFMA